MVEKCYGCRTEVADAPTREWVWVPLFECCNGPGAGFGLACGPCWRAADEGERLRWAREYTEDRARSAGQPMSAVEAFWPTVEKAVKCVTRGYPVKCAMGEHCKDGLVVAGFMRPSLD